MCAEVDRVLVEFSIVPIGRGESVSQYVAECLELIERSGLEYRLNPMGTVVEGGYDEVMALIRECHMHVMEQCGRVITTIKIDDRKGATGMIESKIKSVEKKVGRELKK